MSQHNGGCPLYDPVRLYLPRPHQILPLRPLLERPHGKGRYPCQRQHPHRSPTRARRMSPNTHASIIIARGDSRPLTLHCPIRYHLSVGYEQPYRAMSSPTAKTSEEGVSKNPYGPGRPKRWEKGKSRIPPGTAGEYRIRDKETGAVKYVGETKDLQRRLNQHTRKPRSK